MPAGGDSAPRAGADPGSSRCRTAGVRVRSRSRDCQSGRSTARNEAGVTERSKLLPAFVTPAVLLAGRLRLRSGTAPGLAAVAWLCRPRRLGVGSTAGGMVPGECEPPLVGPAHRKGQLVADRGGRHRLRHGGATGGAGPGGRGEGVRTLVDRDRCRERRPEVGSVCSNHCSREETLAKHLCCHNAGRRR